MKGMKGSYEEIYGTEVAKEIKKKLSKSHLGKHYHLGGIPWNKGKTKETEPRLKKQGETLSKRLKNPEVRERYRKGQLGKKHHWSNKNVPHVWMRGSSNPFKKILGKTFEEYYGEEKAKQMKKNLSMQLRNPSEEIRKKMSIGQLESYKNNPERIKKMMQSLHRKPNLAEKKLNSLLQKTCPNEFKYVGNGEFILGGKCPDFMNVNGKKKLIELYGDYWHEGENPQERIDYFKQYGFDTLVLWEHEIRDNPESIIERVMDFIQGD